MLVEQGLARAAAAALLFEDRLAEVDALAADVNVAGALDQRADVAVALATEGTEGVFLRRSAAAASRIEVSSRWHDCSSSRCCFPPWPSSLFVAAAPGRLAAVFRLPLEMRGQGSFYCSEFCVA